MKTVIILILLIGLVGCTAPTFESCIRDDVEMYEKHGKVCYAMLFDDEQFDAFAAEKGIEYFHGPESICDKFGDLPVSWEDGYVRAVCSQKTARVIDGVMTTEEALYVLGLQ